MKFKKFPNLTILLAAIVIPFISHAETSVELMVPSASEPSTSDSISLPDHTNDVLKLAVVLNDIYGNRDNEFSRGLLLGLNKAPIPKGAMHLKMINGQIPSDSLNAALKEFSPNVIFSTHEKEMPQVLLDFALENGAKLVNIFDAKGEDYKTNSAVCQLLPPSSSFNTNSARYLNDNYAGSILLIVGEPDTSDLILADMVMAWPEDLIEPITFEQLQSYTLEEGLNYLIYPNLNSDKDLQEFMLKIQAKMKDYPLSGIRVIGRPNWIAISELNKKIDGVEVLIPAKCYFDKATDDARHFIIDYKNKYNHTPMISYPVYAVMGYDVANYLVPALVGELRGTATEWTPQDMLQSYFNFCNKDDAMGSYNNGSYILHYVPGKNLQKDLVD